MNERDTQPARIGHEQKKEWWVDVCREVFLIISSCQGPEAQREGQECCI